MKIDKEKYILLMKNEFLNTLFQHTIPEDIYLDIYFYEDFGSCTGYLKNIKYPDSLNDMAIKLGFKKIGSKFINSLLEAHKEYG